jgi:hypothetical protein
MQVTWHNATPGGQYQPRYISGPSDQEQKKLPEGKKWFMAPGLQTERGEVKAGTSSFSKIEYQVVSKRSGKNDEVDGSQVCLEKCMAWPGLAHSLLASAEPNTGGLSSRVQRPLSAC